MKRIGFLDIASKTGWACDSLDAEALESGRDRIAPGEAELAIKHGVLNLPKVIDENEGPAMLAFENWLAMWIDTYRLDIVSAEAPRIAGIDFRKTTVATIELQLALYNTAKLVTHRKGALFFKAHRQQVMVHFLGAGHGFAKKQEVILHCNKLGLYPADDNAADAIAGLHYLADLFERPLRVAAGPLFREKVAL